MKLSPKVYRGIEYVAEREMPEDQRKRLGETSSDLEFIKILMADGSIVDRCLTFKEYSRWYDTHFAPTQSSTTADPAPVPNASVRIAFNS